MKEEKENIKGKLDSLIKKVKHENKVLKNLLSKLEQNENTGVEIETNKIKYQKNKSDENIND